MAFWKDWESWEKIVFVLACAMVVVIIFGALVAWMNRWKIKLYNKAFADETKRSQSTWERELGLDHVPFGARALESGVRVDGVYSPKQYTPRQNNTHQGASQSPSSSVQLGSLTPAVSRSSQQHRGAFSPV